MDRLSRNRVSSLRTLAVPSCTGCSLDTWTTRASLFYSAPPILMFPSNPRWFYSCRFSRAVLSATRLYRFYDRWDIHGPFRTLKQIPQVYTPSLPIVHPTPPNSRLLSLSRSPSSPTSSLIRFSFLYLSIRHQRSSTYLLNTSPVPNLIAVRDTCNEIHQFIQCFLDRTILFIRSKTPFFTTFRLFVSSTIRVHIYIYILYVCYIRTIYPY